MPLLVVAVSVVAVGVGVYGWVTAIDSPTTVADGGPQPLPGVSPAVGTPTSPPASPAPSTSPSPTASPSSSASQPAESQSPDGDGDKGDKGDKDDKDDKGDKGDKNGGSGDPGPAVPRDDPVVVLNQTAVTGLAASTAVRLERIGWTVTGVGNWRGDIPTTTVYYPPGLDAEARQLARDLGVDRVRERVPPMRADRLTVILAGSVT